ncbi:MAG: PT domain-containing protein [Clostridia bacterium]|nr:PT domain-containing protein [Clostridia bacterium]
MKKLFAFLTVLTLLAALGAVPAFSDDTGDFVMPGAIVDLASQKGYDAFCAKAEEFDLVSLKTGEYTVHGTNGLVEWEFIKEDGVGFTRFKAKEPLDEKGYNSEGKRPDNEGDFRMTAEIEFPIADYDYISFMYRSSPKAHLSSNQIYVRDDTHSGEFEGTAGMWTPPGLSNKGEWKIKTIQISKSFTAAEGTFKSIRIPIAGRVNEYFDVRYIVVYNSKDLCENFDIAAYHEAVKANEPDPTEEPTAEPTAGPTEKPAETVAPETEKPKDSGCGSVIGGAAALLAACALLPSVRKKKKNDL